MVEEGLNYRKSIEEIETIVGKIEGGQTDIDNLNSEVKRAVFLLQKCKEKLFQTEQELHKIMEQKE
jgi:exodeoxyribonuclease VII small subunit